MNTKDPKGYYKILGINSNATESEIKTAFKRKAMELHPDRNKSKDATKQFQLLNEAFNVLTDTNARAEYDTPVVEVPHQASQTNDQPPEPAVCTVCNKISAQPRYAIFYDVRSFLLSTSKRTYQGIFCSVCAEKKIMRASIITWLFGWWGFPWGPIYSIQTLFINMFGGKRPNDINARLTFYQAWVFAYNNKIDMAYAVAQDALSFAKKIARNADQEDKAIKTEIEEFIEDLKMSGAKAIKLIDTWGRLNKSFYIQASIMLVAGVLITQAIYNEKNTYYSALNTHEPSFTEAAPPATQPQKNVKPVTYKPSYERPLEDPNGNQWPASASYLDGFPQLRTDGRSKVTVDNSRNDSDVFVKLVSIHTEGSLPVRVCFIPAHERFTLENVTAGQYDIRYRDLDSGGLSRSEVFEAKEISTEDGVEYSVLTMTLYKVAHGNMQTYGLDEADF